MLLSLALLASIPLSATEPPIVPESKGRVTVVCFLTVNCPLARLYSARLNELHRNYERRAVFVALAPNAQDGPEALRAFVREHHLAFPLRADPGGQAMERLNATRCPEVCLLDARGKVCYQGRIDDQYAPGSHKPAAGTHYLRDALDAVLAGKPVAVSRTEPVGCLFERGRKPAVAEPVTYTKHIAPILYRRCVACHRPGAVGPFPLTNYDETRDWILMIEEVVRTKRMPPWGADPAHGRFANDPSLTAAESQLLQNWIAAGAPQGNLADQPALPSFPPDGWIIKPDTVYAMEKPFAVPAEGVIEYQRFLIDTERSEDAWIQAIQIRPGNPRVVHHATLRAKRKGVPGFVAMSTGAALGDGQITMYVPGQVPLQLPTGLAKRLPGGWEFILEVHYVPVGSPQTDRTEIGVVWADPRSVRQEMATWVFVEGELRIPPHAADHREQNHYRLPFGVTLFALFPHMHLRGKAFTCEAEYPDGSCEVLLSVPRYDFQWQHRYVLAEPKKLPKGTLLRWTTIYDNSAGNPANPDPSATVRSGEQTTDEMFHAYFDVCRTDPPSLVERAEEAFLTHRWYIMGGAIFGFFAVLVRSRLGVRRTKRMAAEFNSPSPARA